MAMEYWEDKNHGDIWNTCDIWDIYIYICDIYMIYIYIYIGYLDWKKVKISMKVGKKTRYVSSFEQYLCSPGGSPFHPRRNDATTASALGDCCEHPESESRGG